MAGTVRGVPGFLGGVPRLLGGMLSKIHAGFDGDLKVQGQFEAFLVFLEA